MVLCLRRCCEKVSVFLEEKHWLSDVLVLGRGPGLVINAKLRVKFRGLMTPQSGVYNAIDFKVNLM